MKKIFTLFSVLVLAATMFAQLPYNTTYTKNHFNNSSVTVAKNNANWDNSNGVRLGNAALGGFNWDDKYIVIALNQQSIPYQLSFKYKVSSTAVSNPKWYVSESSDNSNWTEIWAATPATTTIITVSTDWVDSNPLTLSKSTKYIRIGFSGNFAGYLSDIVVSDQAYVNNPKVGDNEITSLDFGANTISSGVEEKTFDVEWCNVPALSVSSDNALFTVSPASFGGTAKYGTQTITVGYNRNQEVGEHSGTITLTNGSVTKTVTVSGSTTKREQDIHWNADLAATNFTMNSGDVLTGNELATADNTEAEITYASDNTDVIAVSEDGKTLYAGETGTATITVTATGNDIYNEKTETQVFTVTSDNKQVIEWDQNFMSLKTNANPNTIELTATATSGGVVTYALEEGSDACVTLGGENNAIMTITGTPGVAYIIATQAGGEINGEVWIAATARKQIKVRDPQSACDEYALADAQYTFAKGDKSGIVNTVFDLQGKPTNLTFYAKRGDLKYIWETQTPLYIDQYANFGSGLEWRQVTSVLPTKDGGNFGPIALDETATKIRFRTSEYAEQAITNISIPRKKEMVVSETNIVENAERNVRWSKTISVSRSNVDVVDIMVESADPNCQFSVSKTSIGTDCADRTTETFEVSITPLVRDSVYTGTITITDGKANPTTHTINLAITSIGFNQTVNDFTLPTTCLTTAEVEVLPTTATSDLEVVYLSSDSTIAYVENNQLVILSAGTVDIIAYQAGDERYNEASLAKTIEIQLTPSQIIEAPTATEMAIGAPLSMSQLQGGLASVEGTFAWQNPDQIMNEGGFATVVFTPTLSNIYASATVDVVVPVVANPTLYFEYTAEFCEGDSIELYGEMMEAVATEEGEPIELTFEGANQYGGDSIVYLTIIVHEAEYVELYDTMYIGDTLRVEPGVWTESEYQMVLDQAEYPMDAENEFELVQHTQTEFGCPKTIVWYVKVTEKPVGTGIEDVQSDDVQCTKILRDGVIYIHRDGKEYTITGLEVK